ncbi:MAG: RnfABCDGE type electron transport complex subunit B [Candidatus Omnitrophica bacterium]|nr:RnfABCDGE type electron transport complex subunit B [Candidatus Omnitrophota bacterium]
MVILVSALILGGLGLLFGAALAFASKKFCVVSDPRLEKVLHELPGANCGACGMPGCMGFAEGLLHGTCTVEKCAVLKEDQRYQIADILGVKAQEKVKKVAVLHCHGGTKRAKLKFIYRGLETCTAVSLVMQGPQSCVWGCIGYGDCVRICPFGAITTGDEGLPVVDQDKCLACGKCVEGCPKQLFTLVPADKTYAVRCKSADLGKIVMQACTIGCISCFKCQKSCPVGAIKVVDNLAVIDYNICTNSGECYRVCPTKAIAKKEAKRWRTKG